MSSLNLKEIVATSAVITTMGQMLAGTLICKDIYKKGTTKGVDPTPFVGGTVMCLLMLRYALILGDPAMININLFGLAVNIIYVLVFYAYSPDKDQVIGMIVKAAVFAGFFLGYAQWEHQDLIQFRYGMIVTVLLILLIASPFLHLGEVLRTKSTEMLPFPLILMGTLVSFQWLLYGLLIDDAFIIFQNALGLTLNAVQLSLFAIFPSRPTETDKSTVLKKKE
ncbi:sugar transporter SWEET1 [Venturia canescens]|uniref:sugar transporter SWEET1 n=1 Tax=Venturia canescens TaxID=32260 RepID=UPI001C9BE575|nr:sugar transporter SWEET1 [Venturia canescens]